MLYLASYNHAENGSSPHAQTVVNRRQGDESLGGGAMCQADASSHLSRMPLKVAKQPDARVGTQLLPGALTIRPKLPGNPVRDTLPRHGSLSRMGPWALTGLKLTLPESSPTVITCLHVYTIDITILVEHLVNLCNASAMEGGRGNRRAPKDRHAAWQ
eukprot:1157951-Pelagomonas_calceolata.AAC.6